MRRRKRRRCAAPPPPPPSSYLGLVRRNATADVFPGARTRGPLQAAQQRLAFARLWQVHKHPPLCADVMHVVGRAVRGIDGLNALLRDCGLARHKAIFVRLLTDVLDMAAGKLGLPERYSKLSRQQQITVLADARRARPAYFRNVLTAWSNVGLVRCRRIERILAAVKSETPLPFYAERAPITG